MTVITFIVDPALHASVFCRTTNFSSLLIDYGTKRSEIFILQPINTLEKLLSKFANDIRKRRIRHLITERYMTS